MEQDYTKQTLEKLEELGKKTEYENSIVKQRIDTASLTRKSARAELRKDNINQIGIYLMWFFGIALMCFVILIFVAGLFSNKVPSTEGFNALKELFVAMVEHSRVIILIVIGYFFRDYASEITGRLSRD